MKKILTTSALIIGLLAGGSAHASDAIDLAHLGSTIAGWLADGFNFVKTNTKYGLDKIHQGFEKNAWIKDARAAKEAFDQTRAIADEAKGYMNDPAGSILATTALDPANVEKNKHLPSNYRDDQVKNFKSGIHGGDIGPAAVKILNDIQEKPSTFSITSDQRGRFEKAMPDRDAREAAYYLAMSEEAYKQASARYDELSKDYGPKIQAATDLKDKENMQMELQSAQLMLQSQMIQLTALKQTHEARKEVAEARNRQLQKNKKDMKLISVL